MKDIELIQYKTHLMLKEIDHVFINDKYTQEQQAEMVIYRDYLREIENNNYNFIYPPEFFKISLTFDKDIKIFSLLREIEIGKIKLNKSR